MSSQNKPTTSTIETTSSISRRHFLKSAAIATGVTILPSRVVFGQDTPSNHMMLGAIGLGRMGQGDLREALNRGLERGARVIALCDVDSKRLQNAKAIVEEVYREEFGDDSPLPPV